LEAPFWRVGLCFALRPAGVAFRGEVHIDDSCAAFAETAGDAGVGEELLEFLGADGGELDLAGVEFTEHFLEGVVVVLGHLGDAVVCGHVADFLGAVCVSLAFDGNLLAAATRHHDEAVALGDTA
jgi:hypothetical protein